MVMSSRIKSIQRKVEYYADAETLTGKIHATSNRVIDFLLFLDKLYGGLFRSKQAIKDVVAKLVMIG
jgi:hypothetical protein